MCDHADLLTVGYIASASNVDINLCAADPDARSGCEGQSTLKLPMSEAMLPQNEAVFYCLYNAPVGYGCSVPKSCHVTPNRNFGAVLPPTR